MARSWLLLVALGGCGDNWDARDDAGGWRHDAAPMSCAPGLAAGVPITTAIQPRWLTILDADDDGVLDLMYGSTDPLSGEGVIGRLPGLGDGTFGLETLHPIGIAFELLAFGDADGDGIIDAVSAEESVRAVDFHAGLGDGAFAAPEHHEFATATQPPPTGLAIGAWTVDSATQNGIVVTGSHSYSTAALVLAADGTQLSSLAWPLTPVGSSYLPVARDLDGNGSNELVALDSGYIRWGYGKTWSSVTVHGIASATSSERSTVSCGAAGPDADLTAHHHLHVANIDGDPYLDLVALDPSGTACVISSAADGILVKVASVSGLRAVVPLDFVGDDAAELVTFTGSSVRIVRVMATSDGIGETEGLATYPFGLVSLATAADLDRDGVTDVVAAAFEEKQITVLRGSCTP